MGQAHAMEGDLWNFFLGPESTRPPDFDPHLLQVRFISQKKKKFLHQTNNVLGSSAHLHQK